MKALQQAAQSNPQLAGELKALQEKYSLQLRELAAKYHVELPPRDLSDEELGDASGGWPGGQF